MADNQELKHIYDILKNIHEALEIISDKLEKLEIQYGN